MQYHATVVSLTDPPQTDLDRIADCTSTATADNIQDAVKLALDNSAVNCPRRIYVEDDEGRIVKGPYLLRAKVLS